MVKFTLLSLLALIPLTLSSPPCSHQNHVKSTFELNYQPNSEPLLGSLRLIQTGEDKEPEWMTENDVMKLKRNNINFMDVTDYLELGTHYKSSSKFGKKILIFNIFNQNLKLISYALILLIDLNKSIHNIFRISDKSFLS